MLDGQFFTLPVPPVRCEPCPRRPNPALHPVGAAFPLQQSASGAVAQRRRPAVVTGLQLSRERSVPANVPALRAFAARPAPYPVAPPVQQEGVLSRIFDWVFGTGPRIAQTAVPARYTATTRTTEISFGPFHLSQSVSYTPDSIAITLPNGASVSAAGAYARRSGTWPGAGNSGHGCATAAVALKPADGSTERSTATLAGSPTTPGRTPKRAHRQ